jgi:chromosome segregation ATPase
MVNSKIDIKTLLILILGGVLIFNIVFDDSKEIEYYENEITLLKEENKKLLNNNDSLEVVNNKLAKEIEILLSDIDSTQVKLNKLEGDIKDLKNGKAKVSGYVNNLNADGVARSLSDYLNKR